MFVPEPGSQQAADQLFWFAHELRATSRWQPDLAALRAGPIRVVVGVGAESAGQLCDRNTTALAAALGIERTTFPGGHIGFTEDPAPSPPACVRSWSSAGQRGERGEGVAGWPHVHFEVFPRLAVATSASAAITTSQLALPEQTCREVYATAGYEGSVDNLTDPTLDSDNIFADGYATQLATITGSVTTGLTAALTVPVAP